MQTRSVFQITALASVLCLASLGAAQGDPAMLQKIADEGKNRSQVMKTLRHIAFDIGPRLTGSPQLAAGQKWAVDQFKAWGLKNVHLEKWGETPVGFDRGQHP